MPLQSHKRLELKRWLGRVFGRERRERDIVLLYHSVAGGPLSISRARFVAQMDWLKAHARVVCLDEMLTGVNNGGIRVVLSFDDGYETLHGVVREVLAERGLTAIAYVNSGLIGDIARNDSAESQGHWPNERFLLWSETRTLAEAGWTIGGHGIEHIDLTAVAPADVLKQLTACREQIELKLGRECRHFAYTWGRWNACAKHLAVEAGYLSAMGGIHGAIEPNSDRYALPRIDIRAEYELDDFVAAVTGRWDFLAVRQRLVRFFR